MRDTRKDERQRLMDSGFQPYEATALSLQPFEQWIEDWQVKKAELDARLALRVM